MKRPLSELDLIRDLRDERAMERRTLIPWTSMHILVEELLRVIVYHECRFQVTIVHPDHCATISSARDFVLETALPVMFGIYSDKDGEDYSPTIANVLAGVANAEKLNPWMYEYYAYALTLLAKRRRMQHSLCREFRIVKRKP
jgi:hypothetical protein